MKIGFGFLGACLNLLCSTLAHRVLLVGDNGSRTARTLCGADAIGLSRSGHCTMRDSPTGTSISIHVESGSFCARDGVDGDHPTLVLYLVDLGNDQASLDHIRSWRPELADEMCVREAPARLIGLGPASDDVADNTRERAERYAKEQDMPFEVLGNNDLSLRNAIQNHVR